MHILVEKLTWRGIFVVVVLVTIAAVTEGVVKAIWEKVADHGTPVVSTFEPYKAGLPYGSGKEVSTLPYGSGGIVDGTYGSGGIADGTYGSGTEERSTKRRPKK
jgi:hypothetical protein